MVWQWPIPANAPFKAPALTARPDPAKTVHASPTAAPGNTGEQGGRGDPGGGSGTPPADSDAQPSSDGSPLASAHESPSPPEKDAAGSSADAPAAAPEGLDKPSGSDEETGGVGVTKTTQQDLHLLRRRVAPCATWVYPPPPSSWRRERPWRRISCRRSEAIRATQPLRRGVRQLR